jgi:hypothetical protein
MSRDSEAIDNIQYNDERKRMRVIFKTGRVYDYLDVPAGEYQAFRDAESWGKHFNAHIRNRYEHREVT